MTLYLSPNSGITTDFNGPKLERQGVTVVVSFASLPHDGPLSVFDKRASTKGVQDQRPEKGVRWRPQAGTNYNNLLGLGVDTKSLGKFWVYPNRLNLTRLQLHF